MTDLAGRTEAEVLILQMKAAKATSAADLQPSLRVDVSYALVTLGTSAVWSIITGWLLYFYLPPAGSGGEPGRALVPAALYSAAMLATRALNAAIAPPVGYLSDHTRSRWGRRLPYLAISGLPMLALFVLLWTPPVATESGWNLLYLVFVLGLYNAAYTLHQIPYAALLPELALTDRHRVRISAWSASMMLVGTVLGGLAGPAINRFGYLGMALLYGSVALPLLYAPLAVLRERSGRQIAAAERLNVRQAVTTMLHNRAFRVLTASGLLYWSVTSFLLAVVPFIVTEVCLLTVSDTLYFYIAAIVTSLACYPVVTWLVGRVGKWAVFTGSLLAGALVLPTLMLISPALPLGLLAQGLLWITLEAIAMSGVTMLPPVFGAEVIDHDETVTGQRREGFYAAAWGLLDQVANGVAGAALPLLLLLGRSRFDPRGPLGVRLVGALGGVLLLAAFLIFLRYPFRNRAGRAQGGRHD